jgi:threonine efflux protein
VAIGNGLYIAIAILGWTGIRDNETLFSAIEIAGASYLLWIGFQLIRSKSRSVTLDTAIDLVPHPVKQMILGLNSALLNPKNALFYMSLMAVILGSDVTLTQQLICGVWMVLVVLLWDILIAVLIRQNHVRQFLNRKIHLIERGAGAVLMSFGLALFYQYTDKA